MRTQQLKDILEQYNYIDFAFLFGSYADDTAKIVSDVDIGIYTNRPIDLLEQGYLISTLEDSLDKTIDNVELMEKLKYRGYLD